MMRIPFGYKYIALFLLLWIPLQGYASLSFAVCKPLNTIYDPIHASTHNCHTEEKSKAISLPCHHCVFCYCCDISIILMIPSYIKVSLSFILTYIITFPLFLSERLYKPPQYNIVRLIHFDSTNLSSD